jgi:hypothetical protein
VSVSPDPARTEEVSATDARCDEAEFQLTGGPVSLYLQLWNRAAGHVVPQLWRERARIVW